MAEATIVLIDDNIDMLELMDLVLSDEGYTTIPSMDGDDAYELIRKQRPDMAILDLRMGGGRTGHSTLDLLRADARTSDIPVLMVSADHQFLTEHASLFQHYGCDVLLKPFLINELLGKVRASLAPTSIGYRH